MCQSQKYSEFLSTVLWVITQPQALLSQLVVLDAAPIALYKQSFSLSLPPLNTNTLQSSHKFRHPTVHTLFEFDLVIHQDPPLPHSN